MGAGVGELHREPSRIGAVPPRCIDRRESRPVEVLTAREVARIRRAARQAGGREQPGQVVAHAPRGRERRQIRGPLDPTLPGDRAPDRREHERGEDEDEAAAEHSRQSLPTLPGSLRAAGVRLPQAEQRPEDRWAPSDARPRAGSGERATRGQRRRRTGGDSGAEALPGQLIDGERGKRALRGERDEDHSPGRIQLLKFHGRDPEPTRKVDNRKLRAGVLDRSGHGGQPVRADEGEVTEMPACGRLTSGRPQRLLDPARARGREQGRAFCAASPASIRSVAPPVRGAASAATAAARRGSRADRILWRGSRRSPLSLRGRDQASELTVSASAISANGAGGLAPPGLARPSRSPASAAGPPGSASAAASLALRPAAPARAGLGRPIGDRERIADQEELQGEGGRQEQRRQARE